jgi:hypothetical protein
LEKAQKNSTFDTYFILLKLTRCLQLQPQKRKLTLFQCVSEIQGMRKTKEKMGLQTEKKGEQDV